MNSVVCTIASGDYHWGGAALINSLAQAGFKGTIVYAHPDDVIWAPQHDLSKPLQIENVEVRFKKIPKQTITFAYKPQLILETLEEFGDTPYVFFFDCDIVVKAPWAEIEKWGTDGIALCQDFHMGYMPHNHIRRKAWKRWVEENDIDIRLATLREHYYNAGFIGVNQNNKEFLNTWKSLCDKLINQTQPHRDHLPQISNQPDGHHLNPLYFYDQDAMNMALMSVDDEINFFDHKGMDVNYWGPYMSHALGPHKPWKGHFLKRVFNNQPILYPDIAFLLFINGPISIFSKIKRTLFKLEFKIARVLEKLIGRPQT